MLKNEFQRKHWPSCTIRENSRHAATTWAGRDAVPAPWHLCTLPTVMLSPARFPWEGASWLHTEQGATNSMVCRPSSLTCAWAWLSRDSVPPVPLEHSSPNLGGLKHYKAFRNHAFGLQNTGYSFLQQIWPDLWEDGYWAVRTRGPQYQLHARGRCPPWICSILQQLDLNLDQETGNQLPDFLPFSVVYAFCALCLQKERPTSSALARALWSTLGSCCSLNFSKTMRLASVISDLPCPYKPAVC